MWLTSDDPCGPPFRRLCRILSRRDEVAGYLEKGDPPASQGACMSLLLPLSAALADLHHAPCCCRGVRIRQRPSRPPPLASWKQHLPPETPRACPRLSRPERRPGVQPTRDAPFSIPPSTCPPYFSVSSHQQCFPFATWTPSWSCHRNLKLHTSRFRDQHNHTGYSVGTCGFLRNSVLPAWSSPLQVLSRPAIV